MPLLVRSGSRVAANRAEHLNRRRNDPDSQLKSEPPDACVFGPSFLTAVDSADARGVVSGERVRGRTMGTMPRSQDDRRGRWRGSP